MARIVQSLTQPLEKYDQQIQQSFVRDVDSIVQKLNTSYQKLSISKQIVYFVFYIFFVLDIETRSKIAKFFLIYKMYIHSTTNH